MTRSSMTLLAVLAALLFGPSTLRPPAGADEFVPDVKEASGEAAQAIAGFRVPEGFSIAPWAAEPLLANPVAFCVDDRGRAFVAETFRLHNGVTDNRYHMDWLDDDMAAETVADRVAMYREYLDPETFESYGAAPDRVRRIVDTDGDGEADEATVFATGFDGQAAGIGAGLLARDGDVWFTCIPDLYRLVDEDDDGEAEVVESLHTGYGVHVAFLGHDLHGLTFGPDGKLYFSVGDRGLNVETGGGDRLVEPHTGSILRCAPDGSGLEIVATGLRNPQELAFDDHGNLFTVDNNSDGGDQARLVDVVEGGDSGWRMGYQYLTEPVARGPWNAELLWKPQSEGNDAAYLLPPLVNVSDGPSGLVYNPGGARLPGRYDGHFFLADFRGTPGMSGIRSFAVEPDGASFRMVDQHQFLWSILATDVDFAPDGAMLVLDWVEGWRMTGKGRIYSLTPDGSEGDETAAEVARLLGEGFDGRPIDELVGLLGHDDRRVRQRAQFALADRGDGALEAIAEALDDPEEMVRLHALWAAGQVARPRSVRLAIGALDDPSPHVRGQAAKLLGTLLEHPSKSSTVERGHRRLVELLGDPNPRVRMYAAIASGKLAFDEAVAPLAALIRDNVDDDPYLRHAGVMGLRGAADAEALDVLAGDQSAAVRLATLLVYRRDGDPEVARFLDDPEPRLVLEAARAINDENIGDAMAKLAALEVDDETAVPVIRRVLNANVRVGDPESARRVAQIAAGDGLPGDVRVEALDRLAEWATPRGRDRIVGLWRPVPERSPAAAAEALRSVVVDLLADAPDDVRTAAARSVGALELRDLGPSLVRLFEDDGRAAEARVEAVRALEVLEDSGLTSVARRAAEDEQPAVRTEGLRLLARLEPEAALPILDAVLQRGGIEERQGALATLGAMEVDEADRVLSDWLDKLLDGDVPGEVQLDLLEAAARRSAAELRAKIARFEAARPRGDPLAPYRECLVGGDAERGRAIFFERTEAQCLRCHKIDGEGGEVGPDLSGIGADRDRTYLLEAIVRPDARVAEGFETLVVATVDGRILSGIVKQDDGRAVTLIDAEGKFTRLAKEEIEASRRGVSAMPEDLIDELSKRDLRDLVEYLAGRTSPAPSEGHP